MTRDKRFWLVVYFLFCHVFTGVVQNTHRDSLRSLLNTNQKITLEPADTVRVNQLNELALSFFPSAPDSLLYYAQIALREGQELSFLSGMALSYRYIGIAHYSVGHYDDALENYEKAIEISLETGNKSDLASNYNNMAIIFDIRGDNEAALEHYLKSLEINREINSERGIAYNLLNIGLINYNFGKTLQALDAQMEALKVCERIDDKIGIAMALNNIGSIFIGLEKYEEALEKNRRALEIRREINDISGISSSLSNIGDVYMARNYIDSALYYYNLALRNAESIDDKRMRMQVLVSLGDIAFDAKDYDKAGEYYMQALQTVLLMGDQYNIAYTKVKIAYVKLRLGDIRQALDYGHSALKTGRDIENMWVMQEANKVLAEIYESTGEISKAFGYYKEYIEISDSLNNSEIQRSSARMDAEYEYLKKENEFFIMQKELELSNRYRLNRQILLTILVIIVAVSLAVILLITYNSRQRLKKAFAELKVTNLEIERQKEQLQIQANELEKANHAKNRLFSIIGHDLRTPIAYAAMAIDMIIDKEPEFVEKTIPMIKSNVDNVHSLVENLLEWAKVQMQGEKIATTETDLFEISSSVLTTLDSQIRKKEIKVINEISQGSVVWADKNLAEIVLRNLLSNAMKFSNAGGDIKVFTAHRDDSLCVCVQDHGMGMSEKEVSLLFQDKLFTRKGTDNEKGSGLGLTLCKEIIEKSDGQLWIESEPGKGTRVWFCLPKPVGQG
jgi:two-component system, sensor histidine kinase and response regulator